MPVVIFNKHDPSLDTSWCDEVVNIMRPNILGNPFPIGGRNSRQFVIQSFADYLASPKATPQRQEIARLRELHQQGKTIALLCCCVPLPCHAHIIKEQIESQVV